MAELSPTSVSQVSRLPHNSFPQSDGLLIGATRARFSHNVEEQYVWMIRDAQLDVISARLPESDKSQMRQQLIGSFNFAQILSDASVKIVAVTQLVDKFALNNHKYEHVLLVGLSGSSNGSTLCLVDFRLSAIIRCIDCPFKISSLETITTELVQPHWPLAEELQVMNGIVSIGSEGGLVFLLDLTLDEMTCGYDARTHRKVSFAVHHSVHFDISLKRQSSLVHNQALCLPLNADAQHKDKFYFRNNLGECLARLSAPQVSVTSLHYVPQTMMLCVGFNFGSFQLFNLQTFKIETVCDIDDTLPPVLAFLFMEPENDPRNYCYLWIVRGSEIEEEKSFEDELNVRQSMISECTDAVMHALCYEGKEWVNEYGTLYKGLISVEHRYLYSFSTKPYQSDQMYTYKSRLIDCYTIQQGDLTSVDDDSASLDLGLCVFVWEACEGNSSTSSSSTYMAIFDINQWYQAQMPDRIRIYSDSNFSSYLGIFSLNDLANIVSSDAILDVHLDALTIAKFRSESCQHDLHYYPSSLSFQAKVITESQICLATYLGLPNRILSQIVASGPSILLDPKEYIGQCMDAGLIPFDHSNALSVSSQRELLLTLALENDGLPFLIETIQQWSTGDLNHVGCNCKFILDWIWKRVSFIKSSIDEITFPLFDYSGQFLDHVNVTFLSSYESDLKCLIVLLKELQVHGTPTTEQGMSELNVRKEITIMISMYLRVLLWLLDANLLPEHAENEAFGENEIAFPITLFTKYFDERRQELGATESSSLLLIDGIVESVNNSNPKLSELWKQGGGSGMFPPPNLHSLIAIYLLESVPIELKHSIMYYTLLELISYLSDRQIDIAERIRTFPSVFNQTAGFTKFIQGIWALDHKEFTFGMGALFDPSVKSILSNDQSFKSFHLLQHRIVEVLLNQHQHQKALLYSQSSGEFATDSPQKEKLHLALLLLNGQISEAFEYQRVCRTESSMEELLVYLFSACEQMGQIEKIFKLPLDELEEEVLVQYMLDTSSEPNAKQILVLYFILNNKIIDAANLLNQCKGEFDEITNNELFQKTQKLSTLISAYVTALPKSLTKLAREIYMIEEKRQKGGKHKVVSGQTKTPLKVSAVEKTSIPWMAPSQVIESVMEQIEAVWAKEQSPIKKSSTPMKSTHSRRGSLLSQKAPFLRTPITDLRSSRSKQLVDSMYLRSPSDALSLTEKKMEAIKNRKKKPLDSKKGKEKATANITQPPKSFDHSNLMEFSHLHSILETPKIERKSARKQDVSVSQMSGITSQSYSTPTSILKVKQMMRRSQSPLTPLAHSKQPISQRASSRAGSQASTTASSQQKLRFVGIPSPEADSPEESQQEAEMDVSNSMIEDSSEIGTFGSIQDTFKLNAPNILDMMDEDDSDGNTTPTIAQSMLTQESNLPSFLSEQIIDPSALMSEEDLTIDESQFQSQQSMLSPPATRARSRSKSKEKEKEKSKVKDKAVDKLSASSLSSKMQVEEKSTEESFLTRRDSRSRSHTPVSNVDESASDISQKSKASSTRSKTKKASKSSTVPPVPPASSDVSPSLPDTPAHTMTTRSKSKTPTKSTGKKGKKKAQDL